MVQKNPTVRKCVQSRIFFAYLIMEFLFKFYLLNIYSRNTREIFPRMKTKLFIFVALSSLGHVISCLSQGLIFCTPEALPFYVLPEQGCSGSSSVPLHVLIPLLRVFSLPLSAWQTCPPPSFQIQSRHLPDMGNSSLALAHQRGSLLFRSTVLPCSLVPTLVEFINWFIIVFGGLI